MICYALAQLKGWDVGSGQTESQCGATTDRIKGSGSRWNKDNAIGIMILEAMHQSNLWEPYGNYQLKQAA